MDNAINRIPFKETGLLDKVFLTGPQEPGYVLLLT